MFWISMHSGSDESHRQVEGGTFTVGRSEESDLVISHETLSRRHGAFTWLDGAIYLEDLGSSNGTFVNGEKIPARRRVRLDEADEITMGDSDATLRVSTTDPAAAVVRPLSLVASPAPAAVAAPFEKREGPQVLREEIETLLSLKATEKTELESLRQSVADLQERLAHGQASLKDLEAQRARASAEESLKTQAASGDITELIEGYLKSLDVRREDIVPLLGEVNALLTGDASPPLVHRWQRLQPKVTGAVTGMALTLAGLGVYQAVRRPTVEESPVPLRVVAATPPPAPVAPAAPVAPMPPIARQFRDSYVDSVLGSPEFAAKYLGADFQRTLTRELVPNGARTWRVPEAKVQQALAVTAELVKALAEKKASAGAATPEDVDAMRRLELDARAELTELLAAGDAYARLMDMERALFDR